MQDKPDTELITLALDNHHSAYAVLVDRYKTAVYRHCFAITRDEDTSEDITQDTFITAYYKLSSYNPDYKFATWVFKIANNKTLTHIKKQKRLIPLTDEHVTKLHSPHPTPETQAKTAELHTAIAKLRPEYQTIISLYYWQGLDYTEVAYAVNRPPGTVKVWMKRAKEQLRKELS